MVGMDEEHDIALLKIISYHQYFRPVKLRDRAEKGLPVLAIGFPNQLEKSVTAGVVSAFYDGFTYSDLAIEHGSSGGGTFDASGQLLASVP